MGKHPAQRAGSPPMTDQLGVLALVTSTLDAAGIPYMLTGAMASGYYGQPRMTRDLDLVVELRDGDPDRLHALLGEAFLLSADGAREAVRRQTMFNAIHKDAFVKVDFVVRKAEPYRVEEFGRRRRVALDGHEMWMVSPEDLILSKLVWGQASNSDVQARDVRAVIAAQAAHLDWAYLTTWADALGVSDALRQARA